MWLDAAASASEVASSGDAHGWGFPTNRNYMTTHIRQCNMDFARKAICGMPAGVPRAAYQLGHHWLESRSRQAGGPQHVGKGAEHDFVTGIDAPALRRTRRPSDVSSALGTA